MARVERSYLYVPGDRPEMLAKAATRGADVVIIDLEDAVRPSTRQRRGASPPPPAPTCAPVEPPSWSE